MNAGEHVGRSFSPFRRFSRKALVPGGDTCDLVHKFIKLSDNPLVKYHIFLLAYVEKKSYRSSFLVGDAMLYVTSHHLSNIRVLRYHVMHGHTCHLHADAGKEERPFFLD